MKKILIISGPPASGKTSLVEFIKSLDPRSKLLHIDGVSTREDLNRYMEKVRKHKLFDAIIIETQMYVTSIHDKDVTLINLYGKTSKS